MPNRTVVAATAASHFPLATSITQCPVNSVPVLPDISCQRASASAAEAGLPYARPSRSSIESQPITRPSFSLEATPDALADARTWVSSPVLGAEYASSSTPLTMTSGWTPAARSTASRAGDAEARTTRTPPNLTRTELKKLPGVTIRAMRFGLVGTGYWAKITHAPALASTPGAELTAVWGRDPAAAAALAAEHGATAHTDFGAFLDSVDAVAFAVPPHVQAPLAIRAAQAGKHLLLEKPIALSADDAD